MYVELQNVYSKLNVYFMSLLFLKKSVAFPKKTNIIILKR